MGSRWATFDCYGTLVDWNAGVGTELARLFGDSRADDLLERYHVLEPRVQSDHPDASYRDVMATVLAQLASEAGTDLPEGEADALGRSLPSWPVFDDVRGALDEAYERGWKLMALSNSDRDLIDASIAEIDVPFEGAIVASEIGSYKPAHGHWKAFYKSTRADPALHVHVAQSHFHDIAPAVDLGIPSVWINRLGEAAEPPPSRELPGLTGLADVLDELVAEPTGRALTGPRYSSIARNASARAISRRQRFCSSLPSSALSRPFARRRGGTRARGGRVSSTRRASSTISRAELSTTCR